MTKKVTLSSNALQVAEARYFMEGENWETCTRRVAENVASIEKDKEYYTEKFHEMIYEMDFLPGGRILRNSGREKSSLLNCYVLPIDDSIEMIGAFISEALQLWSQGGGVGCCFSPLRPKGDPILGKGGVSSGLVSFMKAADAVSKTIESGGQRRAAALGCCDISHPEILDFINAKIIDGEISHFNISVLINEEFIRAVEDDKDWTFKFKQKEYGKIRARELWNHIINNMIKHAEPGILNTTNLYRNNSWYYDPVVSTNPCVTGDTLVAVADGRTSVPIKQLAEEGKDVLIHCCDEKGHCYVRTGRNPRKTGEQKDIWEVKFTDGSSIRCTDNHKFLLKNGEKVECLNLVPGDRLIAFKMTRDYYEIMRDGSSAHKLIMECVLNKKIKYPEYIIHHIDVNGLNNTLENLQLLTPEEHNRLHMIGDKNPMRDKWWNIASEEEKEEYRKNMSELKSGDKNGMYGKKHKPETIEKMRDKSIKQFESEESRIKLSNTIKEWYKENGTDHLKKPRSKRVEIECAYIKCDNIITMTEAKYNNYIKNNKKPCCSISCANKVRGENTTDSRSSYFDNEQIIDLGVKFFNTFGNLPSYNKWDEWRKSLDTIICSAGVVANRFNGFVEFSKIIENIIKEANHVVESITYCGKEDVYNITVDEFHTVGYITKVSKNENIEILEGIYTSNCGEAVLENYGSCCLGSLVLPNFITGSINTNWKKLENRIKLAIRFLDNVIDVNKYSLKEIEMKAQNSRRIGLGFMGLAEYLFAKKLRYGSKEAVEEIEKLMRFIRDTAYQASVELSVEKGSFPKFEPNQYGNSSFVRKLPAQLRMDIKNKGIRNVTLLSIAPAGSIGLVASVSGGVEPLMFKYYKRSDRVSKRIYIHPKYKEFVLSGDKVPDWFVSMEDLTPKDHLETLSIIQKYTDGSCSKTINLPSGYTKEQLSDLLLEYIRDLKGVTIYVDGSREGQVYEKMTEEEAFEIVIKETIGVSSDLLENDIECNCSKQKDEETGEESESCELNLSKEGE